MAVRPIDLQVNMNTIFEVSRREGDRMARETGRQRDKDRQAIEAARQRSRQINQTAESDADPKMSDTEKHFGTRSQIEDEAKYFTENSRKRYGRKSDRDQASEDDASDEDNNPNYSDDDSHHINTYA